MKFINVTGGTISGSGNLILSKNESAIYVEGCKDVVVTNLFLVGVSAGKLRQTWEALKFIWSSHENHA